MGVSHLRRDWAEGNDSRHCHTKSVASSNSCDRRSPLYGCGFEDRLAVSCQPVISRNSEIDGHNTFTNESMCQVARNIRFGLAGAEIAARRFDYERQSSPKFPYSLAF